MTPPVCDEESLQTRIARNAHHRGHENNRTKDDCLSSLELGPAIPPPVKERITSHPPPPGMSSCHGSAVTELASKMARKTRVYPFNPRPRRRSDSYPEKSTYCVKYTMFFMNVLFWIISCLIVAIGVYAMMAKQELYGKISSLTTDPAVILVAVGAIMFIISFAGCLGALRENLCLLRFFSAMLGIMLVLEITAAVLGYVYYGRVKEEINAAFNKMIVRYRDDPDLQLIIDSVQKELKCCGSESYQDWQKNEYFNCSSPSVEKCGVPYSCCLSDQINSQCGFGILRKEKEEAKLKVHVRGCLEGVESWLKTNLILMASIGAAFPFLQLTGFALARRLSGDIKDVLARMR